MIPIHDISEADKKEVKIIELDKKRLNDATEPHRHQYFECFVFLKGGGVHVIDFTEFPIQSNSIHIVTPGQVHQVKRHLNSTGFVFLFEMILFDNAKHIENFLFDHTCFDVNEFSPSYHFEKSFARELENIVKQTWREYNSDNVIRNQLVINQLSLLILYCMRNRIKVTADASTKHLGVYSSFRRLLSTEFKKLKKVKEYSSALNITEKQLNERVLQRTGETASAFINKQIILEAKRLLNTGISAKEVAYELNYTDPAHFSKFFKTQTGISPTDFKKIHD